MLVLDASLRPLERDAPSGWREHYDARQLCRLAARPVYGWIGLQTFAAAAIVTVVTLVLAFPYAWTMVRTPRPAVRKLLLVALFLPFFIGQVVRAYGWLIVLGKQGLLNAGLRRVRPAVGRDPLHLSRPCCSGWSSTCCRLPC